MTTPVVLKFKRLSIEKWRQFDRIDLELHEQLTVITGSNGSGKSTLLNLFSGHFGYQRPFLATPNLDESGNLRYLTGIFEWISSKLKGAKAPGQAKVGEIEYTNGMRSAANLPESSTAQYSMGFNNQQTVAGFHVPSHRKMPNYSAVGSIPTQSMLPAAAYNSFNNEMSVLFNGGHSNTSPTYRIKEALIGMAVFGPQTSHNRGNPVLVRAFDGFVEVLRNILPSEIGFLNISIRTPDVVLVTKSGDFLIDAASGGLMAIIELAWQIYMFSLGTPDFVVTIDEPENHLHPSMQQTIMGNLVKAFPRVQFIVATHSPFIVSAVRNARVYVLRYSERSNSGESNLHQPQQERFVHSVLLDSVNRAGAASQILRDVLGLQNTYPVWVREDVEDIVKKFSARPFSEQLLQEIRAELDKTGYHDLFPEVVRGVLRL